MEIFTYQGFVALLQVIGIDLVLAGDNAIVIGLAAAGLPKELRGKAILVGIAAATVMRIGFALITTQLLAIVGLLLAGGILLLQGVVEIIRCVICMRTGAWPSREEDVEEVDVDKLKQMVHVKDADIEALDRLVVTKGGQ